MRASLIVLGAIARTSIAGYVLDDDYNPSNFLDKFNFYADEDPTEGFVQLTSRAAGLSSGIIQQRPNSVYLGVDSTNVTPKGRPSLRLESKKNYDAGLIIADIPHMPVGCGTWPAFWMIGPDWPSHGEIDIIEGVNSQSSNAMTLHTLPGCTISNSGSFSGVVRTTNCDTKAPGQGSNVGCGIQSSDTTTYGHGFNDAQGGVYAMEWKPDGISVWHFPRNRIPSDVASGNPNPGSWTRPLAHFSGGCNFGESIKKQQLIIDTTFCGQWAGAQDVWNADPVCSKKAPTCKEYVQNNPQDFAQAYWEFNSIKVYQYKDTPAPPPVVVAPPPPPRPVETALRIPVEQPAPPPVVQASPTLQAPVAPPPTKTYDSASIWSVIASINAKTKTRTTSRTLSTQALHISSPFSHDIPEPSITAAPLNEVALYANDTSPLDAVTSTSITIIRALTATNTTLSTIPPYPRNISLSTVLLSKPAPVSVPFEPIQAITTLLTLKTTIARVEVTVTVTAEQADVTAAFEQAFQSVVRERSPGGFIDARPLARGLGEIRGPNGGIHRKRWWRFGL